MAGAPFRRPENLPHGDSEGNGEDKYIYKKARVNRSRKSFITAIYFRFGSLNMSPFPSLLETRKKLY